VAKYPDIATLHPLGNAGSKELPTGDQSLPLLALEIDGAPAGSPSAQLLGATHGDEQIGAEVALDIAQRVCEAYASRDGSAADALARSVRLVVLPVVNPWGYENDSRLTASGIDINRNFDWAWAYGGDAGKGDHAGQAVEVGLLSADAQAERFALAVTLHSGDYCITLPWDYIPTSSSTYSYTLGEFIDLYSPSYELFVAQAAAYVGLERASASGLSGAFSMIEGCDWYVVCGSYADWLYGTLGCPCYTVELHGERDWTTLQGASLGAKVVQAHEAALIGLLSTAGMGARGRVTDAELGVEGAKVEALALPSTGSRALPSPRPYKPFALTDADGYFFVALSPGNWSLTATKEALVTASPTSVAVGADGYSSNVSLVVR
jgi:hypothetical protein